MLMTSEFISNTRVSTLQTANTRTLLTADRLRISIKHQMCIPDKFTTVPLCLLYFNFKLGYDSDFFCLLLSALG